MEQLPGAGGEKETPSVFKRGMDTQAIQWGQREGPKGVPKVCVRGDRKGVDLGWGEGAGFPWRGGICGGAYRASSEAQRHSGDSEESAFRKSAGTG